jgi:hypothetical protein
MEAKCGLMGVKGMEPPFSFHFRLLINVKIPLGIKEGWFFGGPFLLKGSESQASALSLKA